ncbi:MAG: guanitoxin biosynthesis heme-dependent pre-guanitoxin N-hydroxylase GntA [Agriterribacter sp.]
MPLPSVETSTLAEALPAFIGNERFPCLMAKSALNNAQLKCITVKHMACPAHDAAVLNFLYQFIEEYKQHQKGYCSAAVIFEQPTAITEDLFERLLWERLQALADMDALHYAYDARVSANPMDNNFSFSLKEEAFYIIGMHPASSRKARRFSHPTLIFNPHAQFELLREANKYERIKSQIRKRDVQLSGSVNPMLADFGNASETLQYSGKLYNGRWKCPLHPKHPHK